MRIIDSLERKAVCADCLATIGFMPEEVVYRRVEYGPHIICPGCGGIVRLNANPAGCNTPLRKGVSK